MARQTIGGRLVHAYNAFTNQSVQSNKPTTSTFGTNYSIRPDRLRLSFSNERSIVSSIYTRIGIDTAKVALRHVRLDAENRYVEDLRSGLNRCLSIEANLDQASRAFLQDVAMSLCNEGVAVLVPVDTTVSPEETGGYDILTMRVGTVVSWHPKHVRVSLYNEETGRREELMLNKRTVAIIENPLYSVMNEPNSTLQRLIRKLNLLDAVDEQSSSGKLDMIIQLPYTIKSEARRAQAEQRRKDIEFQLKGSQYGIAYTDGTEKITQLNRPAENNLLKQIEFLVDMLYGQLGLTAEIMNGTADEAAMLNYFDRTIEPILGAIAEAMKRSFLTKTAITQGQSIEYYRDPFKLVPMAQLAEMADKFTRNEIVSSNEFRGFIGLKPSKDPKADELRNSNVPQPGDPGMATPAPAEATPPDTSAFDEIDKVLDSVFQDLGVDEAASP